MHPSVCYPIFGNCFAHKISA